MKKYFMLVIAAVFFSECVASDDSYLKQAKYLMDKKLFKILHF